MNGATNITPTDRVSDAERQVEEFYTWARDHWAEMSSDIEGRPSGMLNFGCWDQGEQRLCEAQENLRRKIVAALGDLPSGAHGLEIGGGTCGNAIRLVKDRDVKVTCLDLVPSQLEIGKRLAKEAEVADALSFRYGNSMDMPFPDRYFDFVYCVESSFHYPDKAAFASEAFRVLKPNGVAVIADITCTDISRVRFTNGNYFASASEMLRSIAEAGLLSTSVADIGRDVYRPLQRFVAQFNAGRRDKLARYWNLVLKNYVTLSDQGLMGYHIFCVRRPAP